MAEPELISVADAIAVIDAAPVSPRMVRVRLEDAQGLRLAQDITSDRDYPPFDKSLMDGYAVRSADVAGAPVELTVIGETAAGSQPARPIGAGETVAIMTGAPMPQGADGVIPIEETRAAGDSVRILRAETPQRFITKRGADCAAGSTVLRKGTRLEAAPLAVAASVGAAEVDAFARPRVAVLSTGDELVDFHDTPAAAQIRNSNNIMLVALLKRLGCDVADMGIVRDDFAATRARVDEGMSQHDILFVSGGMSMGQYDFVPKALIDLGVELKITKLRIKPGKPFVFGVWGEGSGFGVQ